MHSEQVNALGFSELTGLDVDVKVVDIGANPIDGDPPYLPMLRREEAEVIGFEPNPQALEALNRSKSTRETYLPNAIGDGGRHTLHICAASGMTSLLAPDPDVLQLFHGFPMWGHVIATDPIDTYRLDDVPQASGANLLKMDIQGAELMVLKNAVKCLETVGVVHAEVEFLPLYKGQPLFGEVHAFLRQKGFAFHRFNPIVTRMVQPLSLGGDPYSGLSQQVWADAIFIRDLTQLDRCADDKLIKSAAILHDCYQSIDIVMHILAELDRRRGTSLAGLYLGRLQSSVGAAPRRRAA